VHTACEATIQECLGGNLLRFLTLEKMRGRTYEAEEPASLGE
jgi:hypothetical protein